MQGSAERSVSPSGWARTVRCVAATFVALGLARGAAAQTTVVFNGTADVDLGSNLDKLADLDPWSYTLGTDWDERFTIGGIIGSPNSLIIPEVSVFGEVIIPEVRADTRTGARMNGRVTGDVGLEFSADFMASGLEPGVGFRFDPTITFPTTPEAGSFISFETTTGLNNNPAFDIDALELPGVTAEVDFFFNLGLDSTIDYGLFPVVPYNSAPFVNFDINLDQRNDPDKSLVKFEASLDPDANNGSPLPPTLTFLDGVELFGQSLTEEIAFLDDSASVVNRQISFEVEDKNKKTPDAPKPRIDVGEVQLVNPFGADTSIIGGSELNLKVDTSVADDSLGFTAETALFRLGLDLDGLATGLATGQSFTRIEEDLTINDTVVAEIVADLIDLKYGPEIGFRETVEINPDFNVTVRFLDPGDGSPVDVALDENGSVTLMSSFSGRWGDLPDVALLTADPVDVEVAFDALTGDQNKRGAFYLTDYLEFTLLELESLNILDTLDVSLPPLLRERTSLLGDLLGELELDAYSDSQAISPFALGGAIPTQSFTITPAPTVLAYLTGPGDFDPQQPGGKLRKLDGHTAVSSAGLAMVTVVIGQGDNTSQSVADFSPIAVTDTGAYISSQELLDQAGIGGFPVDNTLYDDATRVTEVWGLRLVPGSTYEQFGARVWDGPTVINDGFYHGRGQMTTFQNPGGTLLISGGGTIEIDQHARFRADVLIHGAGHSITLDSATGYGLVPGPFEEIIVDDGQSGGPRSEFVRLPDQVVDAPRFIDAANIFINAGTMNLIGSTGEVFAGMSIDNTATGRVFVLGDGNAAAVEDVTFTTPDLTNNGLVLVGPGARLDFRHPSANSAQEFRGDGTLRVQGGEARFLNNVIAYAPDGAAVPDAFSQTFEVTDGGRLEFQGSANFYSKPTFHVGVGSRLEFNGLSFDGTNPGGLSQFDDGAPVEIVNEGTVVFASGSNSLRLSQNIGFGQEPEIIPIGLDNRGTVLIEWDGTGFVPTRLNLDAELRNYAEGGAAFDAGTWEIVAPAPASGLFNNRTSGDNAARLNLDVSQVELGDNYLTTISPGAPDSFPDGFTDTYDPTDYDTFMAVNRSNITLSGRALFQYLNTVQRNEGTLTFDNRNHFITEGDFTNTGTVNITNGGRFDVQGDLLVDGGTVFGDSSASITVNNNTITVDGGLFFFDRNEATLFVNSDWTVREKTVVDDQGNVTEVIPGIVDYGNAVFPVIGPAADIRVEGATAEYRPLRGLETINGRLTLDAGNALTLNQNLTNNGELNVLGGANLFVNAGFTNEGDLTVDADSYALVGGAFTAGADSTTNIDGVLEAAQLNLPDAALVTGAGRISGGIDNTAGNVSPGNSAGILQAFGAYTQRSDATLTIELFGPDPGDDHDQLLAESADLGGNLVLQSTPDVITTAYGKRLDILLTDNGVTGTFNDVLGLEIDPEHTFVLFYEADRVSVVAALKGDANFNGTVEQGDLDTVLQNWGTVGGVDWTTGDLDGSGSVEQGDLDFVLGGWGLADAFWLNGDIDNNGQVEQGDLDAVLQNWGLDDRVWFGVGDINGSGQVEQGDLDIILGNWGGAAAPDFGGFDPQKVPEPVASSMLVVVVLGLRRRR